MNNFVFSQDPLLFQSYQPPSYNPVNDFEAKQQQQQRYGELMNQYKQMHQPSPNIENDYVGELDNILKSLRNDFSDILAENEEYMMLRNELEGLIHNEIINTVKWKVNSNQKAVKNIERQKEIIKEIKNKNEQEERKNLNELNDYMKNYSNITFDEYKKIKNKKNESRRTETENNNISK